jgi:hypothetical protein
LFTRRSTSSSGLDEEPTEPFELFWNVSEPRTHSSRADPCIEAWLMKQRLPLTYIGDAIATVFPTVMSQPLNASPVPGFRA